MTQPTRAPAVTPASATGANEATTGASAAASAAQRGWSVYAVYSLGFLTLISAFNYLDRGVLGLALPLIKHEMRVSDTALGLASGLAFALFYSLLGVPIAWLADRWSRRNIIAIGFGFWSVMTALTGFVGNIWQLAGARFLMGAGEACGVAPSNALVSDLFPTSRRAMALAILASASSLAYIVFYPLLGWIGQHHGWRAMFIASGVPGLALTLLFVLTVREPPRGAPGSKRPGLEPTSLPASVRFLFGSPAYLLLLLGASLMGASAYAGGTWNPTFLARVHHMRLGEIAAALG
ncbi:MAG: MFS transporter, partial [Steroidobacteraceae bacterium]